MATPEKKTPVSKTTTAVKKTPVKKTPISTSTSVAKKSPVKKTAAKKLPVKKITAQNAVADTEKAVDHAVDSVKKHMNKHIDPTLREKANKFAGEAEFMASSVEKFGESVGSVTDSILPSGNGTTGEFVAGFEKEVSRLFIFRCLWLIIQGPVVFIWSIWYCIISIVHYITMFLTGSRDHTMRKKQTRYRRHVIAWKSYMNAITDKRPDIIVD